jgi:hypothetical protein
MREDHIAGIVEIQVGIREGGTIHIDEVFVADLEDRSDIPGDGDQDQDRDKGEFVVAPSDRM